MCQAPLTHPCEAMCYPISQMKCGPDLLEATLATSGGARIRTQICLSLEPEVSAAELFLGAELNFRIVNAVAVS